MEVVKLLLVHNLYQQPGGEDVSFEAEKALLQRMGHQVVEYTRENVEIAARNPLSVAIEAIWSRQSVRALRRLLRSTRPDVAHFHNTFPLISPSAYYACKEAGVPVVQSLHNYRLLCPAATFYRHGRVCEDCLGRLPWPGVVHACYRQSRAATAAVAMMLTVHRWLQTWQERVDIYIALSDFVRRKFIEGGLPAEKIRVNPNFVERGEMQTPTPELLAEERRYALFVGRLSPEKGIRTLLRAWSLLGGLIPMQVVGDGPLGAEVSRACRQLPAVHWLGRQAPEVVYRLMAGAAFLVLTSEWYETFARVTIEAFAKGTPVITSAIGAPGEIVEDGRTGLHFKPGDPEDLAAKVEWAWDHPAEMAEMGRNARAEYETKYTAERNYQMLIDIYHAAIGQRQADAS